MIPKKIHYCWFGRGKKNKLFYKCFDSWKKYYPDFEIIEWNEDNFDINQNKYMKQAYDYKKYAFVSDYARLKILYDEGGIYFDTDVEALKRVTDEILESGYFAKETFDKITTGLGFGVYPNNDIVKYMLDDYQNIEFINEDGTYDLTPCPIRNTESLTKRGYTIEKTIKEIGKTPIYNPEYFCGWDIDNNHKSITKNTYTIHHYAASWTPKSWRIVAKIKKIISNIIGRDNYDKVRKLKHKIRNNEK